MSRGMDALSCAVESDLPPISAPALRESDWFHRQHRILVAQIGPTGTRVQAAMGLVDHALERVQRAVPLNKVLKVDVLPTASAGFAVSAYDRESMRTVRSAI